MWTTVLVLLAVSALANSKYLAPRAGCSVDANEVFPSPDPIFLQPGKTIEGALNYKDGFIVPDKKTGLINFAVDQKIRVACPGNTLTLTSKVEEEVTCVGGDKYQVGTGTPVTIDKLRCKSDTTDIAVRKDTCASSGTGVEIGFNLTGIFPLMYVCFNEETLETYYVQELVPAELKGYQSGQDRPNFKPDDFFDFDVNAAYTYNSQLAAFTTLLGSSSEAKKYVKDTSNYFLARGHFAARADFIFAAHNRASFHFINVAPQWQIFNGGVWNNLEMGVRNYVIDAGVDLHVYSGGLDILQYPDVNNNLVDIYLQNPLESDQTLKVPKFYFKVLVEPISKKGVAFIGINNPYVPNPYPADYVLCDDVLDQITWLNIRDTNLLYACDVQEFAAKNPNLPALDVTGLLTN